MANNIRLATEADAPQILSIYTPYITDTSVTFETEVPPVEEIVGRMVERHPHLPWLVCEIDGVTAGYAYASPYRARAAYRWGVESSVYIHCDYRRRRIGRALYQSLFAILKLQEYRMVFAGVTHPNPESEAFHISFGFQHIGTFRAAGYKLGAWHDVGWWQFALGPTDTEPAPTKSLLQAMADREWDAALATGLAAIHT